MMPFEKCPVCNGEVVEKEVEKLLRGGKNVAIVSARVDVCLHCGERLYSLETIKFFEEIRIKLEQSDTADFETLGVTFRVAS